MKKPKKWVLIHFPKGDLSKETVVKGNFGPRRLLSKFLPVIRLLKSNFF